MYAHEPRAVDASNDGVRNGGWRRVSAGEEWAAAVELPPYFFKRATTAISTCCHLHLPPRANPPSSSTPLISPDLPELHLRQSSS